LEICGRNALKLTLENGPFMLVCEVSMLMLALNDLDFLTRKRLS